MSATHPFWRPALAGGLAFGLAFLGHALVGAGLGWGLRQAGPGSLAWLVLVPPVLAELGKLLMLRLAGGVPAWPLLGTVFGLCDAALHLSQPGPALATAAGTILLHGALGGLAAAAARRRGVAAGALLALLAHVLASLALILATVALARHQGIPPATAAGMAGLVLALLLALAARSYSAATAREAESPKASASSR